jgi:hypothetical protein
MLTSLKFIKNECIILQHSYNTNYIVAYWLFGIPFGWPNPYTVSNSTHICYPEINTG